jgi:signal transduction histidine kinase
MQFGDWIGLTYWTSMLISILTNIIYIKYLIKKGSQFNNIIVTFLIIGILPFIQNIITTYSIIKMPIYMNSAITNIATFISFIILYDIMFKNVDKAGAVLVLEIITDSFVTLNNYGNIVSFNNNFISTFGNYKKGEYFFNVVNKYFQEYYNDFKSSVYTALLKKEKTSFTCQTMGRYYTVEMLPILNKKRIIGAVILLKDLTELHRKTAELENALKKLKNTQDLLVQSERFNTLGVLMGSITHNMRTPLMTVGGNIELLKKLVGEYKDSINDDSVTLENHLEIAADMDNCLNTSSKTLEYIDEVISAVNEQISEPAYSHTKSSFSVSELMKRIKVLMNHQVLKSKCTLRIEDLIPTEIKIEGNMSILVQVLLNLISNSIQAYTFNNNSGSIYIHSTRDNSFIIISVKDNAGGIPKDIQNKIFSQMTTTKGAGGSGLGLYISYSMVVAKFNGTMWFESHEGLGTTFFVKIPIAKKILKF